MAVIGNGLAHALHGDVRGVGHVRAEANHNEGVLERERKKVELEYRRLRPHGLVPLTATPMTGDA